MPSFEGGVVRSSSCRTCDAVPSVCGRTVAVPPPVTSVLPPCSLAHAAPSVPASLLLPQDPASLQGLSLATILLAMCGNALMVPRALWTRDWVWLTGSMWGSLCFGWAQLLRWEACGLLARQLWGVKHGAMFWCHGMHPKLRARCALCPLLTRVLLHPPPPLAAACSWAAPQPPALASCRCRSLRPAPRCCGPGLAPPSTSMPASAARRPARTEHASLASRWPGQAVLCALDHMLRTLGGTERELRPCPAGMLLMRRQQAPS